MLRNALRCIIALAAFPLAAGLAMGQGQQPEPRIFLEADHAPLGDMLRQLAQQSGMDIVFAERTVQGRAVTGRFIGDDFDTALRTLLRGSGLRAERVRSRQYVIVPDMGIGTSVPQPDFRGTLEGIVRDDESGDVLPGAHVVLAGLDLGTVTNTAGYFAIPGLPPGDYRVRVSFIGYRTVEIEVPVYPASKLERPVIRLSPQPVASATVVVEGSGIERSDLEIVPGTARVGMRTASALPAVLGEGDLFAALEWVPGVMRAGEAGGELVVRGAEAQYNRYLLDGAPVMHPWHTFGLFSIFQPETLKSVRLHKGSLPAEYGGGLSAMLDVEMRDGERQRPGGMVAISPISVRAFAEAPINDRVSLMVTARRTWFDLFMTPRLRLTTSGGLPSFTFAAPFPTDENGEEEQDVGYHFYDLGAKATWRVGDGHRLSLSVYDGADRLAASAPFSTLFDTGTATGSPTIAAEADPLALDANFAWGNRVVSGRYHGLVTERLFLTGTAFYSGYSAHEQTAARVTESSRLQSDYRVRFSEMGLRLDADYYLSLAHQLRAGLRIGGRYFESTLAEEQLRSEALYLRRDQFDRVRALELVAYVQDTWQPAAGWQIQPGLRVEYFGLGSYLSLNPRLHIRRTLQRDRLFLRAGLSRQTQPHHRLRDRYAFTYDLASDRWVPASDRVRPATAWQAAVGMEWVAHRSVSLNAEVFARQLEDILLPRDPFQQKNGLEGPGITPGALLDQYEAGTSRAAGIELSAEAERGRWRGGLSYSLSRTLERVPGSPFRPTRYDSPHQFETFILGGHGPWTFALTGTLRSGYPTTVPIARYSLGDPLADDDAIYLYRPVLNNGRLPLYARLDLAVGYSFDLLGLDWDAQAQAYNVLNRRNTVGLQYGPDLAAMNSTDVAGLPILPMVSLKVRW